jgi:hypothetical protein
MLVLSDRWGWKAAAAAELVGMADAFGESAARYAPLKPTWGVGERRGCFSCARLGKAARPWPGTGTGEFFCGKRDLAQPEPSAVTKPEKCLRIAGATEHTESPHQQHMPVELDTPASC